MGHWPAAFGKGFASVTQQSRSPQDQIAELEAQLGVLRLSRDVSNAVANCKRLDDKLACVIEQICGDASHWCVARAYVTNPQQPDELPKNAIEFSTDPERFGDFCKASRRLTFPMCEDLPGQCLASGVITFFAELDETLVSKRRAEASAAGLKSGLAMPLIHQGQITGVLEFFSTNTARL